MLWILFVLFHSPTLFILHPTACRSCSHSWGTYWVPAVGQAWYTWHRVVTLRKHLVWGGSRWDGMTLKWASVQFPKSKVSSEKRMSIPYRAIRESFLEERVSKSGITEKQTWTKHSVPFYTKWGTKMQEEYLVLHQGCPACESRLTLWGHTLAISQRTFGQGVGGEAGSRQT